MGVGSAGVWAWAAERGDLHGLQGRQNGEGLKYSRHAHRLRKRGDLAVSARQGLKYLRTYVQNMGEGI